MRSLAGSSPLADCFTSNSSTSSGSCSDIEDAEEKTLHQQFQHPQQQQQAEEWSVADSMALYRVKGWGDPFFFVNAAGDLCVRPDGGAAATGVSLRAIIDKAVDSSNANFRPPLIIRFPQIVNSRLLELQSAFDSAIQRHGYNNRFQGVFPVKCNPDRLLVEKIVGCGKSFGFGLEAGSKPELLLAMSCLCTDKASPNAFLICNGYKDEEFIELAFLARKMGINCILVVELVEEVDVIVRVSQRLNAEPVIGLRSKLSTKHGGHWGETCGDNGKFGVSCSEILEIVRRLKSQGMLDCLQLLHFHVGSQIPCLEVVRESVTEAAHLFCELSLLGANMAVLDIGGGLGVDYDGSSSAASDMSVGYTIPQYAEEVVAAVESACALKGLVNKSPIICCESGRGLVSHHSILVFDVHSSSRPPPKLSKQQLLSICQELESELFYFKQHLQESPPPGLGQLCTLIEDGSYRLALECAKQLKNEAAGLFKAGRMSLQLRANVEEVYEVLLAMAASPSVASTYHMNMSMFKSIPDTWAIGQLFPILPLQRLNEEPTERAVLSDLTCDSDGRISAFLCGGGGDGGGSKSLPVHALDDAEKKGPYYLGLFLAGAYQEALSSSHNLFGSTHVVHAVVEDDVDGGSSSSFRITQQVPGSSIATVLRAAHHDPAAMFDSLRCRVASSLSHGRFHSDCQARSALQLLARTFATYTYLHT